MAGGEVPKGVGLREAVQDFHSRIIQDFPDGALAALRWKDGGCRSLVAFFVTRVGFLTFGTNDSQREIG